MLKLINCLVYKKTVTDCMENTFVNALNATGDPETTIIPYLAGKQNGRCCGHTVGFCTFPIFSQKYIENNGDFFYF